MIRQLLEAPDLDGDSTVLGRDAMRQQMSMALGDEFVERLDRGPLELPP